MYGTFLPTLSALFHIFSRIYDIHIHINQNVNFDFSNVLSPTHELHEHICSITTESDIHIYTHTPLPLPLPLCIYMYIYMYICI